MKKLAIIIGLTTVIFAACNGSKNDATVKSEDNITEVKVSKAILQDVEQIASFTGTVEAFHPSDITPSLPVRIDQILVEVGDRVQKGQLLVKMDETQRKQQSLQLANLQIEYNRVLALKEAGGASQQQVDQVKTQVDIMQATVNNLSENVELRSPIDGIVTSKLYNQGELFSAATGKSTILKVMDLTPLKVNINVSSEYFPIVKKGSKVKVYFDIYNDEVFDGVISLIYPTIDPVTRNFVVEVSLPNRDLRARPGMFCRVSLNFGTLKHVVVDDLAIVRQVGTNDKYIFVAKDGIVSKLKVETGHQLGKKVEITTSNIADDADVVVAGQTKLLDGSKIKIQE
jgi:RND family efflux transporter MFP subunit